MSVFSKILGFVSDQFAVSSLAKQMDNQPWLREVMLKINLDFTGENVTDGKPFLEFLQQDASDLEKQEIGKVLASKLMDISRSDNPRLSNREWINGIAHEFAPYRALMTSPADKKVHPGVVGLNQYAADVIEELFKDELTRIGGLEETYQYLNIYSLRMAYFLEIANFVRIRLNDYTSDTDKDWFRPYLFVVCANKEAEMREAMGLDSPCRKTRLMTEKSLIQVNLLNDMDDPLRDVVFAKSRTDWDDQED